MGPSESNINAEQQCRLLGADFKWLNSNILQRHYNDPVSYTEEEKN